MHDMTYQATVVNGHIRLPDGVHLPENAPVLVIVPSEEKARPVRIAGPRLAHPERAAEFEMDVREVTDAGV